MDWRYALCDVQLSEDAIAASLAALRSNWLTMGPRTQALEEEWAARFGSEHGIAVSSGSAGLHLACRAAGVGPGDEVIVPAMSFVADAHAPHWNGGEAVLCDVDSPQMPLVTAETVAGRLSDRTRAVIVVHMFGYPVDIEPIAELCADRGVALIEDCCESTGAVLPGGAPAGSRGELAVHSFFSKTKVPVGEGGIVITDDSAAADNVRLWRSHAMTSVTWDRHRGHAETYDVVDLGYNYRIDEPRAALAAAQVAELDEAVAAVRRVTNCYRSCLGPIDAAEVLFEDERAERAAPYSMPVLLDPDTDRDAVRARLTERRIQTSFYPALSQLTVYRDHAGVGCPHSEDVADRHLTLPLWHTMTAEQVEEICGELAAAIEQV